MKHSVLLFGASGMLGSMLLDVFSKEKSIELFATVRSPIHKKHLQRKYPSVTFIIFDAEKNSVSKVFRKIKNTQWIVNAIGVIKPFIHESNPQEIKRAMLVNAMFPYQLSDAIKNRKTSVIQIATDCVYSGKKGKYIETDQHDALDVYGKTKSLGEVVSPQFIHLRVSIIGPEKGTKKSLLEWFLHQQKNAQLSGFTNHFWNGITTLHFAKICMGIILHDVRFSGIYNIVPSDHVTKAKLLGIFVKEFGRKDILLTKTKASSSIDRTLATIHDKMNKKFWKIAGYNNPLSIGEMVKELAKYMKKNSELSSERQEL